MQHRECVIFGMHKLSESAKILHGCLADMLGLDEHGPGPLAAALAHDHIPRQHRHRHHSEVLPWTILAVVLSLLTFAMAFKIARHCCRRRRHHRLPTLASQLSQLSSQFDTTPNPLLKSSRPTLAVQETGVLPRSEPDWIGNVPWSDWQINQEDISLCQRPDGRLWELGAGASAKVIQFVQQSAFLDIPSCLQNALIASYDAPAPNASEESETALSMCNWSVCVSGGQSAH